MRYSISLLTVVLTVYAAAPEIDEETKKRFETLFGHPDDQNNTNGPTPTNRFSNDSDINLNQSNRANKTECVTEDEQEGVCVYHYQCNPDTRTVNKDGTTLIDFRSNRCPHYLEVCCLLGEIKNKSSPPPETDPDIGCGWSNPGAQAFRIVNDGTTAEFGEYPWMVALLRRSKSAAWSQTDFIGGGSIIHRSVVLTGAHKVDGLKAEEIKCRAGEWDTQTDQEVYPYQERNVRKIVKHEDYYRPSVYNSVALLFLDRPYDLTNAPHMGIACVAKTPPPPNTNCQSMGWGKEFNDKEKYAVVLKKVELPILSRKKCQNDLRNTRLGSRFVLHPSLTCAGGEKGKDTCRGDGGSPLVCPIGDIDPKTESGRFSIFGMVAWGIGCGAEGIPGVYVNVPEFYDWIGARMAEEGYNSDSYTYNP